MQIFTNKIDNIKHQQENQALVVFILFTII